MTLTTVSCEYPDCPGPWKSPEGELNTVVKFLEIHFNSVHTSIHSAQGCSARKQARRPEAVIRMSDDDWQYFLYRWDCYKKMTGLKGKDIELEL
jgi:hypothetical protein